MKKIFTLISMALVAMSVNAQETTQVFSVGNGDFNVTNAAQAIQVKDGDKACANVAILSSPNPDAMYEFVKYDATNQVNIYDETKPINPWTLEEATNRSLGLIVPEFTKYMNGKGSPYITDNFEWEYDSDKGKMKLKDANSTNTQFTSGGDKLPVRGTYFTVTPIVDGTFVLGAFIPKGNRNNPFYVIPVDASTTTYTPLASDKFTVKGYFNNNGWNTGADKKPFEITLPEDLIVQNAYITYTSYAGTPDEVTKTEQPNQQFMGTFQFNVEKGKTYWIFSPQTQVGFYGFTYTYDKKAFEAADPLPEPQLPTAIETVKNIEKAINANAPIFNLAGQKVDKSQKGILIQNGKKFVNK